MRSATLCLVALVAAAALAGASELPSNEEGPRACVSGCAAVACPCPANTLPADCAAACDATRSQCVTDCFSDTVAGVVDTRGPCDEPTHDQCVARCHSLPLPPYGRRIVLNQCLETCPAAPAVVEVAPEQDQDEEGAGRRGRNGNSDQYARCINRCMGLSGPDRDSCYGSCSSSGPHPNVVEVTEESEQQCEKECMLKPCSYPEGCNIVRRTCVEDCQRGSTGSPPPPPPPPPQSRAECRAECENMNCPPEGCSILRRKCYERCDNLSEEVVEVAPEQDQDEEGAGRRGRNGNSDQYARCINRCMGLSGPDRDSCYGSCSSSGPHPDVVEVAPEQDQDEEEQQCIADCNDAPCKEPWGCKTAKRDCIIACQMGNQNGAAADAGVCTRASCAKICYSQFCIAGCGPVRKACLARCPAE